MTIRPFCPEDLDRVLAVTVDSFGPVSIDRNIEERFGLLAGTDWKERKAKDVARDTELFPEGCFVAVEDGQVIGYITSVINEEAKVGRIPNLAVDPAYRRRGVASSLIQRALDFFRERRLVLARIETLEQNVPTQDIYPRFGFEEIARQIHYVCPLEAADDAAEAAPSVDSNAGRE